MHHARRAVQHDLRRNIERLGDWLKFIIALIPILIGLGAASPGCGAPAARRPDPCARRPFFALFIATVLAVAAAMFVSSKRAPESEQPAEPKKTPPKPK
ncbi:MAG: hypothetical protein ACREXX_04195 [Gammaproteobacteria bacterium]